MVTSITIPLTDGLIVHHGIIHPVVSALITIPLADGLIVHDGIIHLNTSY